MGLFGELLNYFGIVGSTVVDTPGITTPNPANLRRVRVDNNGFLMLGAPGALSPIYGVAGNDTTLNPFRQVDFIPQSTGGGKQAITAISANIALTVDKTYHFFTDTIAYCVAGTGGALAATNTCTPIKDGAVYEYVPKTGFDRLAFIRDTADGFVWYGRVEA